jgi:predicted metal-binding membrane protein
MTTRPGGLSGMSVVAPARRQVDRTSPLRSLNPIGLTAIILAAALAAWIVTVDRMQGMDAGPGTDLGGLGWYVGIWVTMMAAMMLPSVAPMVLIFARVSREHQRRGRALFVPTWVFLAGYLAAWVAYGLVAYGVLRLVTFLDAGFLAWDEGGPYVAGGAIAAAGLYQLTPLKNLCLRHCRGPMHFILHGWREGRTGALRMGAEHGLYCVGCCWGLMVILFVLGVMSLFWMAAVAAIIFAEKVLPYGLRLSRVFALAFIAFGIWIAAAPSSVPGLTDPSKAPTMMEMDKMGREHGAGRAGRLAADRPTGLLLGPVGSKVELGGPGRQA